MRRKRRKISWFRLTLIILLFPIIFVWLIYRKIKFSKGRNNENIDIDMDESEKKESESDDDDDDTAFDIQLGDDE